MCCIRYYTISGNSCTRTSNCWDPVMKFGYHQTICAQKDHTRTKRNKIHTEALSLQATSCALAPKLSFKPLFYISPMLFWLNYQRESVWQSTSFYCLADKQEQIKERFWTTLCQTSLQSVQTFVFLHWMSSTIQNCDVPYLKEEKQNH